MCQIISLSNGEGSFKMKECAPLHASCEDIGVMGCPLGGAKDSSLPGLDRGRMEQQSLKVAERSHDWFLHDDPPKFDDKEGKDPFPLHKPSLNSLDTEAIS